MKIAGRIGALIVVIAMFVAIAVRAGAAGTSYVQTNSVSDIPGLASTTDPNLLNAWGIAFFPGQSPFWINGNNSRMSEHVTPAAGRVDVTGQMV